MEILQNIQDTRLSPSTNLSDLLRIKLNLSPRYELCCIFLSSICPNAQLSYQLHSFNPNTASLVFLPSLTAILHFNQTIFLFPDTPEGDSTREILKSHADFKISSSFTVNSAYSVIGLCRLWLKFKDDLLFVIDKLNFDLVSMEIRRSIEEMVYFRSKVPVETVLVMLRKAELKVNRFIEDWSVNSAKALQKPVLDIKMITYNRVSAESFSYSQSESTDKFEELSFRVSEAFKDRFPRFSAASISVTETPCKEIRRSFLEYTELIESPKAKEHNNTGNANLTPFDSPKQSAFSINQVKFMLSGVESQEIDTEISRNLKKYESNPQELDEELVKSVQTELTSCSELGRHRMNCDGNIKGCQCSTCIII